jgi:hypothetical protein
MWDASRAEHAGGGVFAAFASSSSPPLPPSLSGTLSDVRRASARHAGCWQIPCFLFVYVCFTLAAVWHTEVGTSFDLASGVARCGGTGGAGGVEPPTAASLADVWTWAASTLIPGTVPAGATGPEEVELDDGTRLVPAQTLCGTGASLVGAVRLSQWRWQPERCALSPVVDDIPLDRFAPITCHAPVEETDGYGSEDLLAEDGGGAGSSSSDQYRPPVPFGLLDVASAYNVTAAFSRIPSGGNSLAILLPDYLLRGYHVALSGETAGAAVDGLAASGWLDARTARVEAIFAAVSLQTRHAAFARVAFTPTDASRIDVQATVRTFPLDPYASRPSLRFLDAVLVLYALLALAQVLYRLASGCICRLVGAYGMGAARPRGTHTLVGSLLTLCTAAAVLAAAGTRWAFISTLAPARGALFSGLGLPLPSASGGGGPPATTLDGLLPLHAAVEASSNAHEVAVDTSLAALALLTLEGVRFLGLQPFVGLLGSSLARAIADAVHLGVVLALVMSAYGIAGHIAFGASAPDWSTVLDASFTLVRMFAAWEYDLGPMAAAHPRFVSFFIGSFMFIVANAILWIWFTIIIDAYTTLRNTLKEGPPVPTLSDDLWGGLTAMAKAMRSLVAPWRIVGSVRARLAVSRAHERVEGALLACIRDARREGVVDSDGRGVEGLGAASSGAGGGVGVGVAGRLSAALRVPEGDVLALLQAYERCDDISGRLQRAVVGVVAASTEVDRQRRAEEKKERERAKGPAAAGVAGAGGSGSSAASSVEAGPETVGGAQPLAASQEQVEVDAVDVMPGGGEGGGEGQGGRQLDPGPFSPGTREWIGGGGGRG